jgi:hypothetical protein
MRQIKDILRLQWSQGLFWRSPTLSCAMAYQDLGVNYYDERKKDAIVRNATKRLERLGYRVALAPVA